MTQEDFEALGFEISEMIKQKRELSSNRFNSKRY